MCISRFIEFKEEKLKLKVQIEDGFIYIIHELIDEVAFYR